MFYLEWKRAEIKQTKRTGNGSAERELMPARVSHRDGRVCANVHEQRLQHVPTSLFATLSRLFTVLKVLT